MLTFYHGLSKEKWVETIEKGYLLHNRKSKEYPSASPVVYLATQKEEAMCYGEVLLEVRYNPFQNPKMNNYQDSCWQLRVYEPIELNNIKQI